MFKLTSHSVDGIATVQRNISDIARVTMKTFRAVRILSRSKTADIIKLFPSTPKKIKNPYNDTNV